MRKSGVLLFSAFAFLVMVGMVSSLNGVCTPDQTLFTMYGPSNTHASAFNVAGYNYKVCYDDISPTVYTGANPHNCNAGNGNSVIWLYSLANSHVSGFSSAVYNVPVCYGDLSCSVKPDCNLANNETRVAYVSDSSNAHISITPIYNLKLCCRSTSGNPPIVTTDVYWKDKFGSVIAYPDPIENGTYVQMFYVKSDLLAGQNVRFDITKGGSVIDSVTVVSTAGRAVARWDTNATTMGLTNSNKEVHLNFTVAGITGPGLNVTLNPGGTPPITVMTGCQYYNSSTPATTRETQCNSDNQGITPLNKRYEDGLWAPSGCDSLSSGEECRCAWKTTSGVSHCTLIKTDGVCEKIYSMEGSCVDGVQKYKVEMNYIGTGADPGECVGTIEDQEGPCGLALAELPFFGVIQIILAALVIFAIYLAITHRKS